METKLINNNSTAANAAEIASYCAIKNQIIKLIPQIVGEGGGGGG